MNDRTQQASKENNPGQRAADPGQSGQQRHGERPDDRQGGDFDTAGQHNTRADHNKFQAGRSADDGSRENLQGAGKQSDPEASPRQGRPPSGGLGDEGSRQDGEARRSGSESGGGRDGDR